MFFQVVLIDFFLFYKIDQMGFIAFYQSRWSVVDVKIPPCWIGTGCELGKQGKICQFLKKWMVEGIKSQDHLVFPRCFNNDLKSFLQPHNTP